MLSASPPILKVFISYSRRDLRIADGFVEALQANNFEVFIDKRGLQYGEEWQDQLAESIRASDTVVWLISEASVVSRWVKWELGEVERLKKRLIPVRVANVDPDTLPESLGKIHALPSDDVFDPGVHFPMLVEALTTDAKWLREATRLLDRAGQWKGKDQDEAQLLRGRALSDAENWVTTKPTAAPAINSEILDLLLHSRQGASRRQRRTVAFSLLLAAGAIALAVYAWLERNSALANQSTYLSKLSAENVAKGDAVTGALLAMSALPTWPYALDRPLVPEAERSLQDAMFSIREMRLLEGHEADVNTAVFGANDSLILTASDDGFARLWRANSGESVRTIGKLFGKVLSAVFLAKGQLILTVDESPTIRLWIASDGSPHRSLDGHSKPIRTVAATRAGDRVVSASADGTVRLWRLDSPEEAPAILRGHSGPVNTAIFSPDEKQVLSASEDGSAILWWPETGQFTQVVHDDVVHQAVFDRAGSMIATISRDQTARVWNASTGKQVAEFWHPRPITWVEFCPSRDCLITAGNDGVARVWDTKTGDVRFLLSGHSKPIFKIVTGPAGRNSALTLGRDGAVLLWDLETGSRILTLNVHSDDVFDAAFSSTGEFLVTTSRDRTARVWRIPAAAATVSRTNIGAETSTIDVEDKAKLVVLGSDNGTVTLLDMNAPGQPTIIAQSKQAVTLVKFNERASQILVGWADGSVALYSAANRERLHAGSTDDSQIVKGSFTKTGFSVLTMSGNTFEHDGTKLAQVRHHDYGVVFTINPAEDDRILVRGDKGARIVNTLNGAVTADLKGDATTVVHAVFSADRRIVAGGTEDGMGRIWDATSGALLDAVDVHSRPIFVALSDDGRHMAIASHDHSVRIWKLGTDEPLAVYRGHISAVGTVRFLPSGRMVSTSRDGEVHFWHFEDDHARAVATTKAMLPRCLTSKQLAAFGLPKRPPGLCKPATESTRNNQP